MYRARQVLDKTSLKSIHFFLYLFLPESWNTAWASTNPIKLK